MADVIKFDQINISRLKETAALKVNIAPPKEQIEDKILADTHAAQPIKSPMDIKRLSNYFLSNNQYRDNMLFIMGINFGLRVSDLLELRFSDVINPDFTFKEYVTIFEKKTRNTRKRAKNRIITINTCVQNAIIQYLENSECSLSDYMFVNSSSNNKYMLEKYNKENDTNYQSKPMSRQAVDQLIKSSTKAIGLEGKYATHSLRKTFAYHYMLQHQNDPRALELLQKMFNHSTMRQTLDYIGITEEEINEAYLNLGDYYQDILIDSEIMNSAS